MTAMLDGVEQGGCNSEPDSRMFYDISSDRGSFLSRDATELVPIGEVSECRV